MRKKSTCLHLYVPNTYEMRLYMFGPSQYSLLIYVAIPQSDFEYNNLQDENCLYMMMIGGHLSESFFFFSNVSL